MLSSLGIRIVLAASALAVTTVASAQDEIYVSNGGNDSVTVYSRTASGNAAPLRTIIGATNTGFDTVEKLDIDPLHGEIVVANEFGDSVTVHSRTATGDVLPLRRVVGVNTALNQPDVPLVDLVHNELFVTTNELGNSIFAVRVFSRTATGNAFPIRNLIGAATGLDDPQGLALDLVNDELYVANGAGPDAVLVFGRTAAGDTPTVRKLTGAATLLAQPEGLVVDTVHNELFVANNGSAVGVTVYARTATGNTAPIRHISGAGTGLTTAEDIALDLAHDELFVVDETGSIRVFARMADGNVSPLRVITGAATGLSNPQGIRVIPWIFADGFELGNTNRWSNAGS